MSGTRDYRTLLSSHRGITETIGQDAEQSKLAVRMINGIQSNKYKQVDYEALRAKAQEMKFSANRSFVKMKKIEQASKDTKDKNMLKQHHAVWMKEHTKLNHMRRRNSADIDLHTKYGLGSDESHHLFKEFEEYSAHLSWDTAQFKKNTVDPLWELREDLKFWVAQISAQRNSNPATAGQDLGSPDEIMQTIFSVRQQQEGILKKLENEAASLEQELDTGILHELQQHTESAPHPGIPPEALELACPDEELRVSVLQEFLLIDQKYAERLQILAEQYSTILDEENGGWSEEEHYMFTVILDQHSHDLQKRRSIYIDRMKRQWPSKTRAEIVAHEDWVIQMKYYQHNKKSLINDWFRDRKELLMKADAIFHEAMMAQQLLEAKAERLKQQRELCDMLYDKVKTWREEKMEAMLLRQRMLEEQRRQAEMIRKQEEERENRKRSKEKEKIKEHHEKLEEQRKIEAEKDRLRLEEIQKQHAEQAILDAERVKYRQELELERQIAQQAKREEEEIKEQEKEARLEALRETVRVVAEPDPYRMIKDTENWQNRRKNKPDVSFNINQQLFEINTFSSNQISSDPRVKLEARLREAGLHNTDYARHIMSHIEPPKPPRKDTMHTVKFGD